MDNGPHGETGNHAPSPVELVQDTEGVLVVILSLRMEERVVLVTPRLLKPAIRKNVVCIQL